MLSKSSSKNENNSLSKAIIIGVIAGGIIGAVFGFLYQYGILVVPGLSSIFLAISMNAIVSGTFIGIVTGVIIGGLSAFFFSNGESNSDTSYSDSKKIELREERLDIAKRRVQTAEVNMHKESFTEEKTFTVPVTREELVIEKKLLNEDKTETIRIPIKEERVEIVKHPVILEDVSYHIDEFQENKSITETLKKEKLKIEHEGSAAIVEKETNTPNLL
jgi:uncharacterized protein (TIGR02271 family)